MLLRWIVVACLLAATAAAIGHAQTPARAQTQAPAAFYAGRTIDLLVGFPPGGGYDLFARPLGRYLGRHIPGAPVVVVKYMPGAGGVVLANHMYSAAPRDGTALAIISPTAPLDARIHPGSVKYVASELAWIGRLMPQPFVAMVWHTAPVRTLDDARRIELTIAGSGLGSGTVGYPRMTNNVLGTRFKIITGYKGSAEALLAMERGEVQGHVTGIEQVKVGRPEWLASGKLHVLTQYMIARHPALPDVPAVVELARTAEEAQILKAVLSAAEIGRFVLTTPGVPAERVTVLRRAFDAMVKDPELISELQKLAMDVLPLTGERLTELVEEVARLSPALIEKVRVAYGE